jgi:hypothetical protein
MFIVLISIMVSQITFGVTKEELATITEAQEAAINDIQVKYEWIVDPPVSVDKASANMIVQKNGRKSVFWAAKRPFGDKSLHVEQAEVFNGIDSWKTESKQAYNGTAGKHLRGNDKKGIAENRGTVTKSKRFILPPELTPFAFTLERFREDFESISKLLKSDQSKLNTEKQKIGDFEVIEADFCFPGEEHSPFLKIFFSEKHNYAPVKFIYMNGSKSTVTLEVNRLKEVSEGLWFPVEGRITDAKKENWSNVYKASDVKVNQNLPDEFFDFEFPPDTKVKDEITGKTYTIKPTQEQVGQTLNGK